MPATSKYLLTNHRAMMSCAIGTVHVSQYTALRKASVPTIKPRAMSEPHVAQHVLWMRGNFPSPSSEGGELASPIGESRPWSRMGCWQVEMSKANQFAALLILKVLVPGRSREASMIRPEMTKAIYRQLRCAMCTFAHGSLHERCTWRSRD